MIPAVVFELEKENAKYILRQINRKLAGVQLTVFAQTMQMFIYCVTDD